MCRSRLIVNLSWKWRSNFDWTFGIIKVGYWSSCYISWCLCNQSLRCVFVGCLLASTYISTAHTAGYSSRQVISPCLTVSPLNETCSWLGGFLRFLSWFLSKTSASEILSKQSIVIYILSKCWWCHVSSRARGDYKINYQSERNRSFTYSYLKQSTLSVYQ